MEFTKLSAPTLKELFIREIEGMILSGQLAVGERLPPERELADKMRVSRAVVNGGISDLARKGFWLVKPRAGVYVADYRRMGTPETIHSIMEYHGGRLRREEICSILEIKLMFDQLAVEQAIAAFRTSTVTVRCSTGSTVLLMRLNSTVPRLLGASQAPSASWFATV